MFNADDRQLLQLRNNRIGGHATAQLERSEDTYCAEQEHCWDRPHVIIPELRVETSRWWLLLQQKSISPAQTPLAEVNSIYFQWHQFL